MAFLARGRLGNHGYTPGAGRPISTAARGSVPKPTRETLLESWRSLALGEALFQEIGVPPLMHQPEHIPSPANSPFVFRVFRVFRWARFSLPPFASLRVFRGQSLFSTTGFQRARLGFLLRQRFATACPPFLSPPTSPASATSAISTTSPPLARPCERVPLTTGLPAATLRLSFLSS